MCLNLTFFTAFLKLTTDQQYSCPLLQVIITVPWLMVASGDSQPAAGPGTTTTFYSTILASAFVSSIENDSSYSSLLML